MKSKVKVKTTETIKWDKGCARLVDQTRLPEKFVYIYCRNLPTLWNAIRSLKVRGAPALGVAAAFGVLLGIKRFRGRDPEKFRRHFNQVCDYIGTSRPTAVNLFNVLNEMRGLVERNPKATVEELRKMLKKKAMDIYELDRRVCRKMASHGAPLIKNGAQILTVCNTGALAAVDYGTALGVMFRAREQRRRFKVYACETRPLLQGARLTTWELLRARIDVTLICDNMAASLMQQGEVDAVFAGADRIALNGDTANKIGTYSLAVLARHHKVPFYIVAPRSTFDSHAKTGEAIPIEQRKKEEVLGFGDCRTAPQAVNVYNPAFDVTDHELITGIVTEYGLIRPPYKKNIKRLLSKPSI